MNLARYLQKHKGETKTLVQQLKSYSDSMKEDKILQVIENAFSEGAMSMIKARRPSSGTKEAAKALEDSSSTGFLKKNIGVIVKTFIDIVEDSIGNDGRVITGWKDVITSEATNIVISTYDLGFLEGLTIAEDPKALEIYKNNREEIYGNVRKE